MQNISRSARCRSGFFAALLAGLLAAGCDSSEAAEAQLPPASASVASVQQSVDGDPTMLLVMADPGAQEPVDQLIRKLQQTVSQTQKIESYVLLGRAWVRKSRETADAGFYLHAKACADAAMARAPGDRMALGLIGQVELNEHRFADALITADSVLASAPEDLPALGNKSDALLELGRYDEAAAVADKMVDLKPSLPSYSRASYLLWLHGELEQAKESARLAIESGNDPSDPEPRCYMLVQAGHIFFQQGDYQGADAGYKKALGECPGFYYALAGRGRVALAEGRARDAVDLLTQATKLSPSIEMRWRLGDAQLAAGDATGAAATYAELVNNGKSEDRRTVAQFLATKNRDLDLALKLARKEMEERPGVQTEDALAWVLYRKGELAEAERLSTRARRLGTKDSLLDYHAGAIAIARGKLKEGRALIEAALARSPRFDATAADEAKLLLEQNAAR
jgi:tetratricopeptide (TPR) repeat protein